MYRCRRWRDIAINADKTVWPSALPSNGARIPGKSKGSFRVRSVLQKDNRILNSESFLESEVSAVLEARRDVTCLREQWPRVPYIDESRTNRLHTFDFHVVLTNGTRVAIAVRPHDRVGKIAPAIRLITEQKAIQSFADTVVIMTERDIENGPARNSRQILRARSMRNEADVQSLRSLISTIWGKFRFCDLLRGLDIPAHRQNALWCLIDDGYLIPTTPGVITDETILMVAKRHQYAA